MEQEGIDGEREREREIHFFLFFNSEIRKIVALKKSEIRLLLYV